MARKFVVTGKGVRAGERAGAATGSTLVAARVAAFYDAELSRCAQGTLIDLGAGESPLRDFYTRFVDRSWSIDWPTSAHDLDIDMAADLNAGLPLRAGSVDTILLSDVLEHLAEAPDFLVECARALRPGGVMIGNVPFLYWLHEEPHDYYRYTEFGLRHLFGRAGFSSVEIINIGGGGDVVVDVVAKCIAQVPVLGPPVAVLLQRLWIRIVPSTPTPEPGRLRRKFPYAYGFVATAPAQTG